MGRGGQNHGGECREGIATRPKGFHLLWSGEHGQVLRVGWLSSPCVPEAPASED